MRPSSLSRRLPLVMGGVALIAVLIAALVSWPLLTSAADVSARRALARTADLTAELLERTYAGEISVHDFDWRVSVRIEALLEPQQVTAYLVVPGSSIISPLRDQDVRAVTSGQEVSAKRATIAGAQLIEGRPVADGLGILFVQPSGVARDLASPALSRLILALLLGLAVAVVIGYWLARRLTRPLAEAAAAANAMRAGQRDVRIDPHGPAEVADIAIALNALAAGLAESEGRQREFLLTVSHELRTPLTSIKGYSEALADGVLDAAEVPEVAGIVRSEADHLDRLVADLLDLARLGAVDVQIEPVDLDLASLGSDAASVWAARSERAGVRFVDDVDRRPMQVRTDPNRVRQIIDNLMENALRVTDEGAPVVLHVAAGPVGHFIVEVRDGGPGLTSDDFAVAFQPGELHARYRGVRKVGSGVGLALVARLAQRLGGRAEAGAAPEGGAAFRVVLPAWLPGPGASQAQGQASGGARVPE